MNSPRIFLPDGVKCCFVVNTHLSMSDENAKEEDVADKILYYIPSDTPVEEQVHDANISEAMISFSSSFEDDSDVKVVKTNRNSYYFCPWEKDTWFVIVLHKRMYRDQANEKCILSFPTDTVTSVMQSFYKVYSMFFGSIESALYKKTEDGKVIVEELIRQRLKLRKARYIEDCIKNGDMADTEDNKKYVDTIPEIETRIQQLSDQSPHSEICQNIYKVLRKCMIYYNWEQLHCIYSIDGFIPLVIDQSIFTDIFTLMSHLYVKNPMIKYSCFLFDDYFVWSDLDKDNQLLLRDFMKMNQDLNQGDNENGIFLTDTDKHYVTNILLTVTEKNESSEKEEKRKQFKLMRYQYNRTIIILLFDSDFDSSTESVDAFRSQFKQRYGQGCGLLNNELCSKRKIISRNNVNDFVVFMYESKTKSLTTNINANWFDIRGTPKLTPLTPSAMINAIPAHMIVPLNHVYENLKDATHFIETAEKVSDTNWVYGCKQHDDILLSLVSVTMKTSVDDLIATVHRMMNEQFGYAFTVV